MKIQVYRFTGLSPLLMANIESVNRDLPQIKLGTQPSKDDIAKVAQGMAYTTEDGEYYMPTQALKSSLLTGCKGTKFPGSRQSPATIFQALINASEDQAILLDKKNKPIKKHEIQIDSGVNKNTKARIIVIRPRINEWHMDVPFEIDDEFAPSNYDQFMEEVVRIWNRAGRMAGLGAWRPECKGKYGKYSVEMV